MNSEADTERFFSLEAIPEEEQLLSRRKFLTGAMAGGAAGLAVAAGTGVAVWQVTDAEAQATVAAADAEVARLQGLVDLYEDLETVGLDAILQTGMTAVSLPLQAVEAGAKALKSGLEWSENALLSLKEALPTAQESLQWLEAQVATVADGIHKLETSVAKAVDKATDNKVAETLQAFAEVVLENLPFGIGDRIRDVFEGMVAFVVSVDELVLGLNTVLLEPMRETWFASTEGEGIGATLIDPLVEQVLDPLESHLGDLAALADTWQQKLMAPTQQALEERAQVREQIARYKTKHGFG
jgi:chromosome segregation ATPase